MYILSAFGLRINHRRAAVGTHRRSSFGAPLAYVDETSSFLADVDIVSTRLTCRAAAPTRCKLYFHGQMNRCGFVRAAGETETTMLLDGRHKLRVAPFIDLVVIRTLPRDDRSETPTLLQARRSYPVGMLSPPPLRPHLLAPNISARDLPSNSMLPAFPRLCVAPNFEDQPGREPRRERWTSQAVGRKARIFGGGENDMEWQFQRGDDEETRTGGMNDGVGWGRQQLPERGGRVRKEWRPRMGGPSRRRGSRWGRVEWDRPRDWDRMASSPPLTTPTPASSAGVEPIQDAPASSVLLRLTWLDLRSLLLSSTSGPPPSPPPPPETFMADSPSPLPLPPPPPTPSRIHPRPITRTRASTETHGNDIATRALCRPHPNLLPHRTSATRSPAWDGIDSSHSTRESRPTWGVVDERRESGVDVKGSALELAARSQPTHLIASSKSEVSTRALRPIWAGGCGDDMARGRKLVVSRKPHTPPPLFGSVIHGAAHASLAAHLSAFHQLVLLGVVANVKFGIADGLLTLLVKYGGGYSWLEVDGGGGVGTEEKKPLRHAPTPTFFKAFKAS
ncbi:hypothetical protein R3P38DRAFT_2763165 [Favolaschia claudopus]|uniref:Uncharacterized protein n=1 Tax=Favolaschia claudopus TaxID=2862362 RepID=A0AAW0DE20_9AGAR